MFVSAGADSVDSPWTCSSLLEVELRSSVDHLGPAITFVGVDEMAVGELQFSDVYVGATAADVGVPGS